MVRPIGRPLARRAPSVEDLCEEFLIHSEARNLSGRTLEWYEDRTRRFAEWCAARGVESPADLTWSHLEGFVLDQRQRGLAPNTVRGYAQIVKSLGRFAYRKGYVPENITVDFQMPRVPETILATFSEEELRALLDASDLRTWVGVRDRAILLVLLDTLMRVSELRGVNAEHLDLGERTIQVMGKGQKARQLPFGKVAAQALRRYLRRVEDLRPGDPLFITRYGRRLSKRAFWEVVVRSAHTAGIEGVRCSPHTLRHTGSKRFILAGGDVFTLQKLLGHTTLAMVRRYVELADVDVKTQHELYSPADSLLRRPRPSPSRPSP